jgi:hypothetical protein
MTGRPRYFILKGCAGLGNRLTTLTWVIRYCLRTGRILVVDWSDGMFGPKGKNPFHDFFELKGVPHVVSSETISDRAALSVYPPIWKEHWDASIYDLYDQAVPYPLFKRLTAAMFSANRWRITETWVLKPEFHSFAENKESLPILGFLRSGRLLPIASNYPEELCQDVLVGADYLPSFSIHTFRQHVSLLPEVTERFIKIACDMKVGKTTLGIHIRQTDWTWQTGIEPILQRLRRARADAHPQVFLATDSAEALDRVRQVMPSVIAYPKFLPRPQTGGLHHWAYYMEDRAVASRMFEESLIDLFLLSRCGTLWYQRGSSFPTVAHTMAESGQVAEDWTQFRC